MHFPPLPPFIKISPPRVPGIPIACSRPDKPVSDNIFANFGGQIPASAQTLLPLIVYLEKLFPRLYNDYEKPSSEKK